MNEVLIDTHVFIWWTGKPERLSSLATDLLSNSKNEPILSLVSVWEMQIKHDLGKLSLEIPLPQLIERELQ